MIYTKGNSQWTTPRRVVFQYTAKYVTKVFCGEQMVWDDKNSNVQGNFLLDSCDIKMWPKHSDCLLRLKVSCRRAQIECVWKNSWGQIQMKLDHVTKIQKNITWPNSHDDQSNLKQIYCAHCANCKPLYQPVPTGSKNWQM